MEEDIKTTSAADALRVGDLSLGLASPTSIVSSSGNQICSGNAKNSFEAVDSIRHAAFVIKSLRSFSSSMRFVRTGREILFFLCDISQDVVFSLSSLSQCITCSTLSFMLCQIISCPILFPNLFFAYLQYPTAYLSVSTNPFTRLYLFCLILSNHVLSYDKSIYSSILFVKLFIVFQLPNTFL